MTDSYKKLIEETIAETKAEMDKSAQKAEDQRQEQKATVAKAFKKASGLISALTKLEKRPGSTFTFKVEQDEEHGKVKIKTNIAAPGRGIGDQGIDVEQDGHIYVRNIDGGTAYLSYDSTGYHSAMATNKEDVEAVVKQVVKAAVKAGMIR